MAAQVLRDRTIRPLGVAKGTQDNLRALHDCKWCHVTSTHLLQPRLLLGRQRDRILGPRAWHSARPPHWANVGQTVVCQPLQLCKPAQYLVRPVLSWLLEPPMRPDRG